MKNVQKVMFKFVAVFALLVITLWGCNDEMNKTGYDLLLPGDLVSARKVSVDKASIKAYTVTDTQVKTNNPQLSLLGTFNDPIFGKTTTDFAYQFRLADFHDLTNATADSLILTLIYKDTYGATGTPQSLKIYELNTDLDPLATYYQDINLKSLSNNEVLAEKMYVPKFKLDSLTSKYGSTKLNPKDTVLQEIRFRLNASMVQKLMAFKAPAVIPGQDNNVNDVFLKYFKGLYIEAGDMNQGGSIMKIFPSYTDPKLFVHNTEMKLYYHSNDTTRDSIIYHVSSNSARVSRFIHNYSSTNFATNLDKMDQQDSLIYLQTTGGLSDKIYIPSLNNWKDSANCAINKAELIFPVDKSKIDTLIYPVPQKIILSLINSTGGIFSDESKRILIFPSDLALSETYYGGTYNKTAGTYSFNLAKHLQEIIKGKGEFKNYGFYLSTDDKNAIFRRVVLKGSSSIRFEITYSKIK